MRNVSLLYYQIANRYVFKIVDGGSVDLLTVSPVYDYFGVPVILSCAYYLRSPGLGASQGSDIRIVNLGTPPFLHVPDQRR